jgi:hypothetical protein
MSEQTLKSIDADDLDVLLGVNDARRRQLLQWPSQQTLGDEPARDLERGGVQLRIGRRPLARSLQSLYRSTRRTVPDEYEIFWGHELWLVDHTVGIIRYDGSEDIEHLGCEVALPDEVTVVEVLPQSRFIAQSGGRHACDVNIGLDGRARAVTAAAGAATTNDSSVPARGARLALYDGPPAIDPFFSEPDAGEPVVGRVSFDVMTPNVQAVGAGDNALQYVFSRHSEPLAGYQSMVSVLLAYKHETALRCSARLHATIAGVNSVPVRLTSDWIPLEIKLDRRSL